MIDIQTVNPVSLFLDARAAYLVVGTDFGNAKFRQTGGTLTIDSAAVFDASGIYYLEGGTLAGTGDLWWVARSPGSAAP